MQQRREKAHPRRCWSFIICILYPRLRGRVNWAELAFIKISHAQIFGYISLFFENHVSIFHFLGFRLYSNDYRGVLLMSSTIRNNAFFFPHISEQIFVVGGDAF